MLLALAILIALIGIVNTLMLSVFERTHEIGLLRAVGMNRRQVRAMIRSESVIVALFGGVVGILRGLALGVALAYALRNNGVTNISVPIPSLIGFALSALLGLVAARATSGRPRRARRHRNRVSALWLQAQALNAALSHSAPASRPDFRRRPNASVPSPSLSHGSSDAVGRESRDNQGAVLVVGHDRTSVDAGR